MLFIIINELKINKLKIYKKNFHIYLNKYS